MSETRSPEIPATPEDLIAAAKRLRIEASVLATQAGAKLSQAEAFEALAGVRSDVAVRMGLPSDADSATLATHMEEQTRGTKVSRARLDRANRKHPFVAALVKSGTTVTAIAAELGYSRSSVQSWYDSDADNGRPIPRAAAEAIKRRLGVPLTAWRKITD